MKKFFCLLFISLSLVACSKEKEFKLPTTHVFGLSNGLKVTVMEDHSLPEVFFHTYFPVGEVDLYADQTGLGLFLATLLIEGGAASYSRESFAKATEQLGASLSASASYEYFSYEGRALSKDLKNYLSLYRVPLVEAAFEQKEFDRIKRDILSGLEQSRDYPETVLNEYFFDLLFSPHPYGRPLSGYTSTVKRFRRSDVLRLYEEWIKPNGAWMYVVGDVDPKEIKDLLEDQLSSWKGYIKAKPKYLHPQIHEPKTILLIDKPDATQSQIAVGIPSVPISNRHYLPLKVSAQAFGGRFGSILNQTLRVEKGLTYGASSGLMALKDLGGFIVQTSTNTETTKEVVSLLIQLTTALVEKGLTESQLQDSKQYLMGHFPLGVETTDVIAQQIFLINFYQLPTNYLQTYRQSVGKITEEMTLKGLETIPLSQMVIAVIGNGKVLEQELKSLGPVKVRKYTEPLEPPSMTPVVEVAHSSPAGSHHDGY
ncbi:MAG TPA: pitrilysin family protein [Bdellovibrionota bacterium]|nr:pitrilysin family protein [Bdellovibrionota bacterium]